ncbi:MAG: chalcone isomerase [Pseudomonadales bacterium]|nr:chalcone isomerase [Pseudomonadales bacterium]|tara:strand:+ start:32 stop:601 length:570 start_codon:yes stop_codon:yes gene_type:complete
MKFVSTLLLGLWLSATVHALELGGITMPETLTTSDGATLHLNGAGIREKWFMDLYVGGLYLLQPSADPDTILSADEPMAIRLHIVSGMITSEKMVNATMEGFENSTGGNVDALDVNIKAFLAAFDEAIKEGDIFAFIYEPGKGIHIMKNGAEYMLVECELAFKQALFGIWLSDKPAQKSLKRDMLGRHG